MTSLVTPMPRHTFSKTKPNSSNSKSLENNLLNITTRDPIYSITASDIYRLLLAKADDNLKPFLAIPQIPLIATDSYFLHYSVAPMLKKQNTDELMNSALKFQHEYVATDHYQYLRTITMLDDDLSKLYSFTLTKTIIEKLYEKLENKLQASSEERQEVENILQQLQQAVQQIQQQLNPSQPQQQSQQGQSQQQQQNQNQQGQGSHQPQQTQQSQQNQQPSPDIDIGRAPEGGDMPMPMPAPYSPSPTPPSPTPVPDIPAPAPTPQQPSQPSQQQNILQQLLNNPQIQQLTQKLLEKLGINGNNFKDLLEEASKEAEQATKELKEITRFAGGKHAGKQPGTIEFLADLADAIRKQKVDVKVIELAGKIADFMPKFTKMKKTKDKHGDELAGYRLTKRFEEALPKELALPDELFYYKLASSGFVAKEKQTIKEGAFYVLIDKSGSMAGEKTIWARAVALALLRLARAKKRRYFARFFDYNVYDLLDDADFQKLLTAILTVQSDGGTSIDSALRTALRDLTEKKLAEQTNTIIIITDGEDEVTVEPEEFKKTNTTLIAVMIQGRNETLQMIAEKTGGKYMKAVLTTDGALKILEEVR
jgi:uncharacterized protein with von Willebrand factor type A (vWA) domain